MRRVVTVEGRRVALLKRGGADGARAIDEGGSDQDAANDDGGVLIKAKTRSHRVTRLKTGEISAFTSCMARKGSMLQLATLSRSVNLPSRTVDPKRFHS